MSTQTPWGYKRKRVIVRVDIVYFFFLDARYYFRLRAPDGTQEYLPMKDYPHLAWMMKEYRSRYFWAKRAWGTNPRLWAIGKALRPENWPDEDSWAKLPYEYIGKRGPEELKKGE